MQETDTNDMNEIFRFGRHKVALADANRKKPADNDARGAVPVTAGSLVPPPKPPQESHDGMARSARISLINASSFELYYVDAAKRRSARERRPN